MWGEAEGKGRVGKCFGREESTTRWGLEFGGKFGGVKEGQDGERERQP